ncbi:hypothetical protein [Streptomyces sp. SID13031]|uniref:hypothetical protein n=1 Tax=Streptomyces sp. SID13031 TaxID=2706046 RepID=UPI0013CD44FB|nr:hypothetical protein [Streptomyces sp. SID13031]NEA34989.1 hypothetical protein [Streptomyces sp. SID13031]
MTLMSLISICWGRSADWGSVAEWVGGIGTAGALILGLLILRRDHTNSERVQIDQVGWWRGKHDGNKGWILANKSTLPIHILIEWEKDWDLYYSNSESTMQTLLPTGLVVGPGDTATFRTLTSTKDAQVGVAAKPIRRMTVTDNAGRHWHHQANSGWKSTKKKPSPAVDAEPSDQTSLRQR